MGNGLIIVGDAGGSSTQWRLIDGDRIEQYETIGFNAYSHNIDDFKTSILQTFGNDLPPDSSTYLYAAGVDNEEQRNEVQNPLKVLFGENFSVENDLLGSARSLCGRSPGNVCILGTGSNACIYDGEKVDKVSASLGYVLGDEGSGAFLGKKLMMKVFRGQFSKHILDAFEDRFHITSHEAIQRIYHQPKPNHFLGSFATFVNEHRNDPEIYQLIYRAFEEFFSAFYGEKVDTDLPFYFSGSIAWFFSDILREVAKEKGVTIKNIVQSPISGLALYHQKYG